MVKINIALIFFLDSGDYTPIDILLKINMSTTTMCVNISTTYDDNPMNMDEAFIVSLSSNDPKVFIPEESANTTVIIENSKLLNTGVIFKFSLLIVLPPDVEPMINKVTKGMNAVFSVKLSNATASNKFQWQHNENNYYNSTGIHAWMMNLTIINVTELHEGNYTYIVTFSSFSGSITSNRAQLLVCKLLLNFIKRDHVFVFLQFHQLILSHIHLIRLLYREAQ